MSTGVENLDRIEKANAWLADIDAGFCTSDRHLAYRRDTGRRREALTSRRVAGNPGVREPAAVKGAVNHGG